MHAINLQHHQTKAVFYEGKEVRKYVDLGLSERIALWELFSDQLQHNFIEMAIVETAVNALYCFQQIPNIDNHRFQLKYTDTALTLVEA